VERDTIAPSYHPTAQAVVRLQQHNDPTIEPDFGAAQKTPQYSQSSNGTTSASKVGKPPTPQTVSAATVLPGRALIAQPPSRFLDRFFRLALLDQKASLGETVSVK